MQQHHAAGALKHFVQGQSNGISEVIDLVWAGAPGRYVR